MIRHSVPLTLAALLALGAGRPAIHAARATPPALKLITYVSDSTSFDVTATLIAGPTEAILVDGLYHKSDAERFADSVAAMHRHLKAIFITHPHDDHYLCIAVWRERFPGTPVYMTASALGVFRRQASGSLVGQKRYLPAETPDSLPTPDLLPSTHLTVDGAAVEIVPDRQGDEWVRSNSYVWIPSLRAVVAGDMVFNGVHVWLANSTHKTRLAWLRDLDSLAALQPKVVVAGHKRSADTPDGPSVVDFTRRYVRAFDRLADEATGSDVLIADMTEMFSDLALRGILARAARQAIPD